MVDQHLIVHSQGPFNAEPPLPRLRAAMVTPQANLYIRSHGNVPQLDAGGYRLRVVGAVAHPLDLSLAELRRRFADRTVTAALQCAGNRRADLQQVRCTSGDPWGAGAIGNVEWNGVPLADVLHAAGASMDANLHVAFDCCDQVELPQQQPFRFGASIPLEKAMAPDTLLAFGMNGEALAPEHGFPLRAMVPGYAGVRSPKWLATITVQDRTSSNPMQASDYKLFPPHVMGEPLDWEAALAIDEMPLNAAICDPAAGAVLQAGQMLLRGYAIASPGRRVARVDVSPDGGRSWTQAALEPGPSPWSWTFWAATLVLSAGAAELAVRAWDSAGQTQPASAAEVWNLKGYLCTAWHRVPVTVQ